MLLSCYAPALIALALHSYGTTRMTAEGLALSTPIATSGNRPVPGLKNGMDYVKLGGSDLYVSKVCSKSTEALKMMMKPATQLFVSISHYGAPP
jgi:hypothetical protein